MSNKQKDLKSRIRRTPSAAASVFDEMELGVEDVNEDVKEEESKVEEVEDQVNLDTEEEETFFTNIRTTEKQKSKPVPTTFYLDEDLAPILQSLYEKNGKGFKTKFINSSIRYILVHYGLIEDA